MRIEICLEGVSLDLRCQLNISSPQGNHVSRLCLHHDRNVHLHVHAKQRLHPCGLHDIVSTRVLYDGLFTRRLWVCRRVDVSRAWRNIFRLAQRRSASFRNLFYYAVLGDLGHVRWYYGELINGNFPRCWNSYNSSHKIRPETTECTRGNDTVGVSFRTKASSKSFKFIGNRKVSFSKISEFVQKAKVIKLP